MHLPHKEILTSVEAGHRLLIDDGKLELKAVSSDGTKIVCTVISGNTISDKKGVSLPDTDLPVGALTEKDQRISTFSSTGVDWVALSFVQRPEDLAEARKIARGCRAADVEDRKAAGGGASCRNHRAFRRVDGGARRPGRGNAARSGARHPEADHARCARRAGKPVVVATQMLESMITAAVPTRAEVSDVSIAVFEGADAIMLSAESAAGEGPVEAVAMMNRIATKVETDPNYAGIINAQRSEPDATGADAISLACREIAETLKLSAIVTYTASGTTGLRAARERPQVPIIALTPILDTARRLSLVWGTHCVVTPDATDLDDMVDRACRIAVEENFGKTGDRIIITAGVRCARRVRPTPASPISAPTKTTSTRIAEGCRWRKPAVLGRHRTRHRRSRPTSATADGGDSPSLTCNVL